MALESGTGATGVDGASASATGGAGAGSTGAVAGESGQSGASVSSGLAPAADGDASLGSDGGAGAAEAAPGPAAAPSEYVFANRKFRDQKHAEDYVKAQLGILPGTQRKLAALEQLVDQLNARNESYARGGSGAPREGVQGADQSAPAAGWGKALQDSGDLDLIAEIHESKGPKAAYFAFAQVLHEQATAAIDAQVEKRVGVIEKGREFDQHMGRVTGALRQLSQQFLEFDESNDSPEAAEARSSIIEIWKSFPREFALGNPLRALRVAAQEYRDEHGTPIFAIPPGSSDSPSALAAAAAERGAGGSAVLDTGVRARPRPSGRPATAQEELADSMGKADSLRAITPTGFDLGVRRVS
jgi:hypothetical protein